MQGPGGGAYIGATPGSLTAKGSTVNGNAVVILNSGTVAGPVTIIALTTTLSGTISTSSGQISIGGGVPSATHFNLATSRFNLQGFVVSAQLPAYRHTLLTGSEITTY